MFTDMAGYSGIAQRDERLALGLLEEHREIIRGILLRFHGIEIKTIGDAFLFEFDSALEASQCAIEVQRPLAKRNHDVPSRRRIDIRIGIPIAKTMFMATASILRRVFKHWRPMAAFASQRTWSGRFAARSKRRSRNWLRWN